MKKHLFILSLVALSACGGGGGDSGAGSAAPAAGLTTGIFSGVTVSGTPSTPTTADTPPLRVAAQHVGSIAASVTSFDVPVNVSRNGAAYRTGQVTFTLNTGTAGSGTWSGVGN